MSLIDFKISTDLTNLLSTKYSLAVESSDRENISIPCFPTTEPAGLRIPQGKQSTQWILSRIKDKKCQIFGVMKDQEETTRLQLKMMMGCGGMTGNWTEYVKDTCEQLCCMRHLLHTIISVNSLTAQPWKKCFGERKVKKFIIMIYRHPVHHMNVRWKHDIQILLALSLGLKWKLWSLEENKTICGPFWVWHTNLNRYGSPSRLNEIDFRKLIRIVLRIRCILSWLKWTLRWKKWA